MEKACCALAEVYGVMLFAREFSQKRIHIATSHALFSRRIGRLFKDVFGVEEENRARQSSYHYIIDRPASVIFDSVGNDFNKNISVHLNRGALDDDCCRSAFLRGAFLSGGSVSAPDKSYHLELRTSHISVGKEVVTLLLDMEMRPSSMMRRGYYIIYLKDSERIEDFLTLIGAPLSSMALMEHKVEKDMRNAVNRQVNCDAANAGRAVIASAAQIEAIKMLISTGRLSQLSPTLRETAEIRLANPELSLSDLIALYTPPISKPGLSHRLKKLIELSKE